MEKVGTPLKATAIYNILIGLIALSPALVRSVFGYEVKDAGAMLVIASYGVGFGFLVWMAAANPAKYGGLAQAVAVALAISIVSLLWGWLRDTFTVRNVGLPIVIEVALVAWIWSSRPRGVGGQ